MTRTNEPDHPGWQPRAEAVSSGTITRSADEGAIPMFTGDSVNVLIDGTHTRGLAAFLEYRLAPHAEGPPMHWHTTVDELFYIVSGSMHMRTADSEGTYGPRDFVFVPRGMPHTFRNPNDDECVFVSTWTPAGAEQAWLLNRQLVEEYRITRYEDFDRVPEERVAELLQVADSISAEPADDHAST